MRREKEGRETREENGRNKKGGKREGGVKRKRKEDKARMGEEARKRTTYVPVSSPTETPEFPSGI